MMKMDRLDMISGNVGKDKPVSTSPVMHMSLKMILGLPLESSAHSAHGFSSRNCDGAGNSRCNSLQVLLGLRDFIVDMNKQQ